MKQLTYAEIELLQYTLLIHMRDSGNQSSNLKSLYNKLTVMRAQLESTKYYKDILEEDIVNSI
jgi:hypothetical protein